MLSDDQKQRIADGIAFRRLMEDENVWPALERLIKHMRDDAMATFAQEDSLSRKWLKGVLDTCDLLLANVKLMVSDSQRAIDEEKELEMASRSRAEDGAGAGDFAGL